MCISACIVHYDKVIGFDFWQTRLFGNVIAYLILASEQTYDAYLGNRVGRQYLGWLVRMCFPLHPRLKSSNDGTWYRYRLRGQIDSSRSDTAQRVGRPSLWRFQFARLKCLAWWKRNVRTRWWCDSWQGREQRWVLLLHRCRNRPNLSHCGNRLLHHHLNVYTGTSTVS